MSLTEKARSAWLDFAHPEFKPTRREGATALAAFILTPVLISVLALLLIQKDLKSWERTLKKPRWAPPFWAIGPVGLTRSVVQGLASWSVWTHGGWEKNKYPLGFYITFVSLSVITAIINVKLRKLDLQLVLVLVQFGVLSSAIVSFHSVEPLASYLLVAVWLLELFSVFFANALLILNPQASKRVFNKIGRSIVKFIKTKSRN